MKPSTLTTKSFASTAERLLKRKEELTSLYKIPAAKRLVDLKAKGLKDFKSVIEVNGKYNTRHYIVIGLDPETFEKHLNLHFNEIETIGNPEIDFIPAMPVLLQKVQKSRKDKEIQACLELQQEKFIRVKNTEWKIVGEYQKGLLIK